MSSHNSRLQKLEQKQAPHRSPRLIVLKDGIYTERGQVLTEAEYQAIASDPANDITLCHIVYTKDWRSNE